MSYAFQAGKSMNFEKPTIDFLKKMGWSHKRSIDIEPFTKSFVANGYTPFSQVKSFLKSYGGLVGVMPAYRVKDAFDRIHFDPTDAMNRIDRETIASYEARVDEKLLVIGEACNQYLTLVLSPTNRMYGGYDDELFLIGHDLADAFSNLFDRREFLAVP